MKTKRTIKRNSRITAYLQKLYEVALNSEYKTDNDKYIALLTDVFQSNVISYREIILVALVGREIDDTFRASTNFYQCNPRGIYDQGPIKNFCIEKGFPHTKSGPLNIAKASNINDEWATQRDDKENAIRVVELIKLIDNGTTKLRNDLGVDLLRKYIAVATYINQLTVSIEPSSDPIYLANLCKTMIDSAPDSGNTPQRIVGYLLLSYHSAIKSGVVVSGAEDSASATSTTSNKPGDINEELSDGTILKVYEITIKKFDLARIIDSYDCVTKFNENFNCEIKEIIVICRNQDCPSEITKTDNKLFLGYYSYQDVIYYYLDIYEWISQLLVHMTSPARNSFYSRLNDYVNSTNTHESVKLAWNTLHKKESEK